MRTVSTRSTSFGHRASSAAQRIADGAADAFDSIRLRVAPQARRVARRSEDFMHRGEDALIGGSLALRDRASLARERSLRYVREQPVKTVLLAGVAVCAVAALAQYLSRRRRGWY